MRGSTPGLLPEPALPAESCLAPWREATKAGNYLNAVSQSQPLSFVEGIHSSGPK